MPVIGNEILRREIIRRSEHRATPQFANTGFMQHGFFTRNLRRIARTLGRLHFLAPQHRVRVVDTRHRLVKTPAILGRQSVEQFAVGHHLIQKSNTCAGVVGKRIGGGCLINGSVLRGV
jgi:hypothetical protein